MSFRSLQFKASLGSPRPEAAAAEGAGSTDSPPTACSLRGWARGSPCRLEFHLGRVACQMVSRNCVTGSQRSPPTCPHEGPESGGCRTGRAHSRFGRLGLPQWTWVPGLLASSLMRLSPSHALLTRTAPQAVSPIPPSWRRPFRLEGEDQATHIWFCRAQQRVCRELVLHKDLLRECMKGFGSLPWERLACSLAP